MQVRVTAGCWGGSHWPAVVLQVSTECPAQPTAAPADWRRHRAPCRSGRVQGSWPWLLGCWFWSIKCTEGPAQVSCDPQATPRGSCNRHSTRSARHVADSEPTCDTQRHTLALARNFFPRAAGGAGGDRGHRVRPGEHPGATARAPRARTGAAKCVSVHSYCDSTATLMLVDSSSNLSLTTSSVHANHLCSSFSSVSSCLPQNSS